VADQPTTAGAWRHCGAEDTHAEHPFVETFRCPGYVGRAGVERPAGPRVTNPVNESAQLIADAINHLGRIQVRMLRDMIAGGYTGRIEDYRDGGHRA
jgi:hypothetical protein